ncbi:glycosyltransferase family 4 protein [Gorillibacterium massiliense]|uniref:glycosyltransferase family 4 protein n=1 Tax=Gorillibacterium massiliense TaxID=1280390 RepID=UPI0004B05638|nr:glycosyltransferase family 4 protein [Gorillibacterium massiliense]
MDILVSGMGWIDHTPGGLNRYFADYLRAMEGEGHSVRGLMTANGEKTSAPSYVKEVSREAGKVNPIARVSAFRKAVAEEIRGYRPDVFNPHFALYASLVTRGLVPDDIPIVTHFHGPWADESLVEDNGKRQGLSQKLRYQMKKNIELMSYRRSDRFIVLSEYFKDILHRQYRIAESRIHIIPGAADHQRFVPHDDRDKLRLELGLAEGQQVLFCARRLAKRMGIDRLIQAMVPVVAEFPETILFIAGDGAMRSQLDQLIADLNLRDHVFLLGRVSNEDLVRWYQAADISIVPTVTLEGFGLVTVEALACGTPVLGTPYGGTKEILQHFSPELLFRDGSPEAMTEKLLAILSGGCPVPARETCRQHVLERYTWEKVARSVHDVFLQAIDERKAKGGVFLEGRAV